MPAEEGGGGRWSLDHLFLDQDAVPTLVEVKRGEDTRIRREVVGQMLDYAANGTRYWPIEAIRARFSDNYARQGLDADTRIAEFLGPDADVEAFWQLAKENLETGRLRLVFVADAIPAELRRVIEFLNEQMDRTEVLAIEVKQYVGQGQTTLVPRIIGQTERAQQKKTTSSTGNSVTWNLDSYLEAIRSRLPDDEIRAVNGIVEWAAKAGTTPWFGKGKTASFGPTLKHNGVVHYFFYLWSDGTIYLNLREMKSRMPFSGRAMKQELVSRLNAIPGFAIPERSLDGQPPMPLSALVDPAARAMFLAVFDWYIETIRAS